MIVYDCDSLLMSGLSAFCSYEPAIYLVSTGRINVKSFITHRFSLEQSLEAFEVARSGNAIKVMIDCEKK